MSLCLLLQPRRFLPVFKHRRNHLGQAFMGIGLLQRVHQTAYCRLRHRTLGYTHASHAVCILLGPLAFLTTEHADILAFQQFQRPLNSCCDLTVSGNDALQLWVLV